MRSTQSASTVLQRIRQNAFVDGILVGAASGIGASLVMIAIYMAFAS